MITPENYFWQKEASPEVTPQIRVAATAHLERVNRLLDAAEIVGVYKRAIDPDTGSCISGAKGGSGDGGFRLSNSSTGAPTSAHKRAQAVDVYDPSNALDNWLTDAMLETYELYREHPNATPGWCHLQSIPPRSGRRTFQP